VAEIALDDRCVCSVFEQLLVRDGRIAEARYLAPFDLLFNAAEFEYAGLVVPTWARTPGQTGRLLRLGARSRDAGQTVARPFRVVDFGGAAPGRSWPAMASRDTHPSREEHLQGGE